MNIKKQFGFFIIELVMIISSLLITLYMGYLLNLDGKWTNLYFLLYFISFNVYIILWLMMVGRNKNA